MLIYLFIYLLYSFIFHLSDALPLCFVFKPYYIHRINHPPDDVSGWVSVTKVYTCCDLSICNLLQKTVSLDSRQNCTKCDPVNCVVLQGEFWKRQVIWSSFVLFLIKFYLQVTRATISNSTFKSSVVTLRDTASKILRDFKEDSII